MPKGMTIDRSAMREQVEILFMAATNAREPTGALAWYANWCGLNRHNVAKWFLEGDSGTMPSRQSVQQLQQVADLVRLQHGDSAINTARIRRRRILRRML